MKNNRGIALVTVILVIAILGILAAVAIETTGTDIINAGNYTSSEQTLSISNSAMNIVLAQLGTSQQTNAGIDIPTSNVYYYTPAVDNTLQKLICVPTALNNYCASVMSLTAANIDPGFSNVLGFTINSGNFGFVYNGTYGEKPSYSLNYYFYNGQINTITQNQNASKTVQTGMTFSYGPIHVGY
ncbi:MAG: hypothetical protein M0Z72_04910 [Deltaproteobacteria bacterium]|nr:hypothetical protein [Deltaproteobacteria bacterium]